MCLLLVLLESILSDLQLSDFLDRAVEVEAILEELVTSDPLCRENVFCNFYSFSMGETRTLKDMTLRKRESWLKVLVLHNFVWLCWVS